MTVAKHASFCCLLLRVARNYSDRKDKDKLGIFADKSVKQKQLSSVFEVVGEL